MVLPVSGATPSSLFDIARYSTAGKSIIHLSIENNSIHNWFISNNFMLQTINVLFILMMFVCGFVWLFACLFADVCLLCNQPAIIMFFVSTKIHISYSNWLVSLNYWTKNLSIHLYDPNTMMSTRTKYGRNRCQFKIRLNAHSGHEGFHRAINLRSDELQQTLCVCVRVYEM